MTLKDTALWSISCFFAAVIFSDRRAVCLFFRGTCMNYSEGRWKSQGNGGVKGAGEITAEVATTCNRLLKVKLQGGCWAIWVGQFWLLNASA